MLPWRKTKYFYMRKKYNDTFYTSLTFIDIMSDVATAIAKRNADVLLELAVYKNNAYGMVRYVTYGIWQHSNIIS